MPLDGPDEWPRITDLSHLEPENFKFRNTQFLNDDDQPYDTGMGYTQPELRRQIWNVRNGDLRCVLEEFPQDEPIREQCALWMHAVVGKHFFPDANHRTAVALLRRLLRQNEIAYKLWSIDRLKEAREQSHAVRAEIEPVHLDTLWRQDRLYDVWLRFFEDELFVHPYR